MSIVGAIEAGGTKFVCAVRRDGKPLKTVTIATRDMNATLGEVEEFFDAMIAAHGPLAAVGIGSFGPLQLDPAAPGYGRITSTPKPGWQGADIPQRIAARYGVPVAIDTDVNAAALAEAREWQCDRLVYVTVGTGIGVGIVLDGRPQAGRGHPEMGHIPVCRPDGLGDFAGVCPFHGDCLEGIASGPAIHARWGAGLSTLPHDHPAWDIEAACLGDLASILILSLAPERIVFGGGVMKQQRLFPAIRAAIARRLAGYSTHWDDAALADRITPARSQEPPGLVGAFLLAETAIPQAA